jgi:hypothetical protein
MDSEGRLKTILYDKRDDLNFPIVNFPFICSNNPAAPAYGIYMIEKTMAKRKRTTQKTEDRATQPPLKTGHGGDRKTFEVMTAT